MQDTTMPDEKLSNATHWKVFFNNLKKSQLIYHSDVKAAIHQNEDIIRYIERKNVSQTLQFTLFTRKYPL